MKTDNIFDLMGSVPELTDGAGSITAAGIDTDSIEGLVSKKIAQSEHVQSKGRKKKKLLFTLLAAAIVIGTFGVTASAAGLLDSVFKGRVELKSESIPIVALPVDVKSEYLDIALDGMTGDDENVYASFTITKKDGGKFIENVDDQTGIELNTDGIMADSNQNYNIRTAAGENGEYVINDKSFVDYRFEDEKTITAFMSVHKDGDDIGSISFRDDKLTAYRFVKVIYQAQPEERKNGSLNYNYKQNKALLDKYTEEYKPRLRQNEIISFDFNRCALCVFEEYSIPFEYEVTLDPTGASEIIDLLEKPIYVNSAKGSFILTKITATNTGMTLRAENITSFEPFLSDRFTVDLSDGSSITADLFEGGSTYDPERAPDDKNTYEAQYVFGERGDFYGLRFTPVDPRKIVSVTIDGATVVLDKR